MSYIQSPSASQPKAKSGNRTGKVGASMNASDDFHVVVRLLPSTGLEGAFRVHVLPESLDHARLKVGDLCEIASEDGTAGCGIAWRADDRMGSRPKNRPAKMTETIRNAFGFDEGSRVTISKTEARIHRADRIVLSDVTPPEYHAVQAGDDGLWRARVISLFSNCEALAPGISFDVYGRRKLRKRFFLETIEAHDASQDAPCLFSYTDSTELVMPRPPLSTTRSSHALPASDRSSPINNSTAVDLTTDVAAHVSWPQYRINSDHIGGLLEQCRKLNRQLQRLLDESVDFERYSSRRPNPPILLHGYQGTGKTMLLRALSETGFKKVVRVNRATLTGGSISRNQNIIQAAFEDAEQNQPSLVLMDSLETLAPSDDVAYSEGIIEGMRLVRNKKVMVVGATRSPSTVHESLLNVPCFSYHLELTIPDLAAREQILNVLQGKPVFARDSISTALAAQTHAFTGADLARLHDRAAIYAADRLDDELDQSALARSPTPPTYEEVVHCIDGPPSVGLARDEVSLSDFKRALQEIRPTALREIFTEKPKTRWSDIGGCTEIKDSFDKTVGWPLQHKELLTALNFRPSKGILLYGPPGCSKTLTAQAVANEYNFNFIAIKGAELISMYVGESERAIREVFRRARTAAPCVIFFDEIDAIGGDRDGGSGGAAASGLNVLTTLLNEMDGFEVLRDVFVLAATNKPASLDPALLRPGRFDAHIYLGPPNSAARREILALGVAGVAIAADVDFATLVADSEDFSGAELVNVCRTAKEQALARYIRGHTAGTVADIRVSAEDFHSALLNQKRVITQKMLAGYEAFRAGHF